MPDEIHRRIFEGEYIAIAEWLFHEPEGKRRWLQIISRNRDAQKQGHGFLLLSDLAVIELQRALNNLPEMK